MTDDAAERDYALAWMKEHGRRITPESYEFYATAVRSICEKADYPYTSRLVTELFMQNLDLYSFARSKGLNLL